MGIVALQMNSTTVTASGVEELAPCSFIDFLAVDVNVTAVSGTSPSLTLLLERLGADGVWYPVWSPSAITAVGALSTSVGPACLTNAVVVPTMRLRWVLGGTSPSFTFSASIHGRP
jgi:hypothetical protein